MAASDVYYYPLYTFTTNRSCKPSERSDLNSEQSDRLNVTFIIVFFSSSYLVVVIDGYNLTKPARTRYIA